MPKIHSNENYKYLSRRSDFTEFDPEKAQKDKSFRNLRKN